MVSLSYGFMPLRLFFALLAKLWAHPKTTAVGAILAAGLAIQGYGSSPRDYVRTTGAKQTSPAEARWARVKTTGYCSCQTCCNWRRSVLGLGAPVIASGPNRGRPKAVGITANGTRARPGVIAADTNLFAFGTVMYVPGYGWGRVEDVGGAIKGYHLDLFFRDHATAQQWGVRKKEIKFLRPAWQQPKGVRIVEK
jgi:3D (Asp-Asp-Asp) domain-containing protein